MPAASLSKASLPRSSRPIDKGSEWCRARSLPQLANPQIRAVFDGLDGRIRALDPNVSQEVRKLCIAYKTETNFVDIVPRAKRLRLSLNMPFAEPDYPRGLAKNVAGVGRWGNGEVEIAVATLEEVPNALGLIRQSLERQLDDAAEVH